MPPTAGAGGRLARRRAQGGVARARGQKHKNRVENTKKRKKIFKQTKYGDLFFQRYRYDSCLSIACLGSNYECTIDADIVPSSALWTKNDLFLTHFGHFRA